MKILSNKIGLAVLLLSFFFIKNEAIGQTFPDIKDFSDDRLVKSALNNVYFYAVDIKLYKNRDINEVKQELENQLKTVLAKKMISNIQVANNSSKSNTTLNLTNDKNGKSSDIIKYEFTTKIESKITFTNPVILFQENTKTKVLVGLIAVDKKNFLDQNYNKLIFDLNTLTDKVDNVLATVAGNTRLNQNKYNDFLLEKNELFSLISVQNILDPQRLSDQSFQENVKELDAKLNELLGKIESADFQQALVDAKNKLSNIDTKNEIKEFKEVVNDFDLLLVKYPGNEAINEAKQEALRYIESKYASKIASTDFIESLTAIKDLGQIDQSFIIKYGDLKIQLVKSAFEFYVGKAERSLINKDYNNAKLILRKVEEYKYYNSSKYDAVLSKIDDNIFKQKLYDIDLLMYSKNYIEAYRVILEMKKEFYLTNMNGINEKETKVIDLLTVQKVDEVKKKRPYTFQFQVGAGLISNFYNIQSNTNIANYQIQTASTTYEFGVYKKVNITENLKENGTDRSTSNAVGFKVSVWVPNQSYNFTNATTTPIQGGLYFKSNIIEPQLSFFTLKMFNLNFGKIIGDIIDKNANTVLNNKLDFYTLTFGLRPHIGNVMLNLNAKLISDLSAKNYVTANASLVLGLNFARRFRSYEYEQVHNAVLKMKNY
jgi:hypothetical protein